MYGHAITMMQWAGVSLVFLGLGLDLVTSYWMPKRVSTAHQHAMHSSIHPLSAAEAVIVHQSSGSSKQALEEFVV
jgi:hypothetical protein